MPLKKDVSLGSTRKKQYHKRRGKSFWIKAVNDFEGSPLSLQDFCAERGLAVWTFHGWRRRLSAGKAPNQNTAQSASKPHPKFLAVYVTSPETPSKNLEQTERLLDPQPLRNKCRENSLDYFSELSSGLSIYFNEALSIRIDKSFHEPTLERLVDLFYPKELETC